MATAATIHTWFEAGVAQGATHMLVVCDTFDHEDYPVYVAPDENVHAVVARKTGSNMQQLMEVYSLLSDPEPQLQPGTWSMNYAHSSVDKHGVSHQA